MKRFLIFFAVLAPITFNFSQGLGELAPEKAPVVFPKNSWGVDLMFGEGGFGLGTFYRRSLGDEFTFFTDFSISEAKDEKETEYVDYFGNVIVFGKKNRVFLMPLYGGVQYRLFSKVLSENLRPYINFGAGPTMVVTTPYSKEFFSSFGKAQAKYTAGAYIGFGANFGLDQKSLIGINLRYYVVRFFDEGVESLEGRFRKDLGGFFLTINIGSMY